MNDPKEVVAFYLQRLETASHPTEKQIIRDDLFLYYHRLSTEECETVKIQMQSLLDELQLELEAKDPLLKRAGDLLRHLEAKRMVVPD